MSTKNVLLIWGSVALMAIATKPIAFTLEGFLLVGANLGLMFLAVKKS